MNAKQRRKVFRELKDKYARPEQLVALRLEGVSRSELSMYVLNHMQRGITNWMQVRLYMHICKQLGVPL